MVLEANNLSSPTVVVVDDDPDVRDSVAEVLTDAGYAVVSLGSCNAALTHLCQTPAPAVVLVDLLMPGMNAWELIGQMRRRESLAKVPVIAMTGSGPQWGAPVPEAMVLRKPIDGARMLDLIRSVVVSATLAASG